MVADVVQDPLELGQRLISVLETGRRTATYKLATLMALIDYSIESAPRSPGETLDVPVRELASRVLDLYWRQARPLEGKIHLRQSRQPVARILRTAETLRLSAGAADRRVPLETAQARVPKEYAAAIEDTTLTLVRQPLHRLQRVGAERGQTFLYDDAWMHDAVTKAELASRGGKIRLYPGVAQALGRLAGLLKPTIEILWVDDVRRMNKTLLTDAPDLMGHLFGQDRIALRPARRALVKAFGAHCFYCGKGVDGSAPVDHVLPWSRVGLDGLTNLVVSCDSCNSDKRESLPAIQHVRRALARDFTIMDALAAETGWPTQRRRVIGAARGLYQGHPAGAPLWSGLRRTEPMDPFWIDELLVLAMD